jgi:glycine cleavage system H protein
MAILLAVLLFTLFIVLAYFVSRGKAAPTQESTTPAAPLTMEPLIEPVFVAGYELPEHCHYHRGHTWARLLGPDTVAVGMDDFARKLVGPVKSVTLPPPGAWIRQGASAFEVETEDRSADLLAPVEGTVIEVNSEVVRHPALCSEDPYGHGWLIKIQSAALAANVRNLMSGHLARHWIEDARAELERRMVVLSGSVLQDGGALHQDFAKHLEFDEWRRLVETFLLTEAHER